MRRSDTFFFIKRLFFCFFSCLFFCFYFFFLTQVLPSSFSFFFHTLVFCQHSGANGLIEYPAKSFCSTSTCSPESDSNTCCKRAPPASCTSIGAGITSFCQHHGANGLAYGATTLFCETAICNVLADASTCCAPASNSATCDSISDVTSFCAAYGKLNFSICLI